MLKGARGDHAARPALHEKEVVMAKGQKKSNKEVRKPKQSKPKAGNAAAPSMKGLGPKD